MVRRGGRGDEDGRGGVDEGGVRVEPRWDAVGCGGDLVDMMSTEEEKARKDVFAVNFHFDGIFTSWPLKYAQGQLPLGLREIKSTQDIAKIMKVGYESGNEIDMYVEHFGYDIIKLVKLEVNEEHNHNSIKESDDEYYGSDDYEEIENVDFQTEGDESLVIKSISTHDPFLTKLCSARIMFRGTAEHLQTEEPLADPDDHQIHAVNKVQSDVLYLAFDPGIPWDKMEPTLGMRYETPYQLKLALANYGVAHDYQLWYMKNNWREVLVYYGRNVEKGRCAGNKDR
nr:F-box domain, leucine-rich repeat domain, L domain-like protein [Tanacetum cinerariifolium]